MKIAISGGHLTPALSVIDYVQSLDSNDEIIFFGRMYSQDNKGQKAVEEEEVEKRNIRFIPFSAPRLVNSSLIKKIKTTFSLISSIFVGWKIVGVEKPDFFLSFGGYVAVPLAIACWIRHIPVVTHEQTRTVGMANSLIAKFATKIALSFDSSAQYFPNKKVVLTGNPVRKALFADSFPTPSWYDTSNMKPILLVMGGNQGSLAINTVIKDSLPELLKDWYIVHQCGKPTTDHHYKNELLEQLKIVDEKNQNSYVVLEWMSENELFWLYRHAHLSVARSGINSVQELALTAVPAIFIPLPFAYMDEQRVNAKWLADINGAVILDQKNLSADSLNSTINDIRPKLKKMRQQLASLKIEKHADAKLYRLLQEL